MTRGIQRGKWGLKGILGVIQTLRGLEGMREGMRETIKRGSNDLREKDWGWGWGGRPQGLLGIEGKGEGAKSC